MEITVDLKEFLVLRNTHIGPLQRELRKGDIIQWIATTKYLAVNGVQVDSKLNVTEAMRVMVGMGGNNPIITPVSFSKPEPVKNELKTVSMDLWQTLFALSKVTERFPAKDGWNILPNQEQKDFIDLFSDYTDQIDTELMSLGGSLQVIDDDLYSGTVGQAIEKIDWLFPNRKTRIGDFSGITIDKGFSIAFSEHIHPYPVVRLSAKKGLTVCLSIVDESPNNTLEFIPLLSRLSKVKTPSVEYKGVSFPEICYFNEAESELLKDLPFAIKFREDSRSSVKEIVSASAFDMRSNNGATVVNGGNLNYIVDKPFCLWIEKGGITIPIFAAVFCQETWVS